MKNYEMLKRVWESATSFLLEIEGADEDRDSGIYECEIEDNDSKVEFCKRVGGRPSVYFRFTRAEVDGGQLIDKKRLSLSVSLSGTDRTCTITPLIYVNEGNPGVESFNSISKIETLKELLTYFHDQRLREIWFLFDLEKRSLEIRQRAGALTVGVFDSMFVFEDMLAIVANEIDVDANCCNWFVNGAPGRDSVQFISREPIYDNMIRGGLMPEADGSGFHFMFRARKTEDIAMAQKLRDSIRD